MSADPDAAAWSPDRIEMLRLHHGLGLSAAMSAELIGGVSRNAVISKRRRLGLVGANPLQAAVRAIKRAVRSAHEGPCGGAAGASGWRFDDALGLRCEPLPFMDWPPPPDADPRPLALHNDGECAWPLGPAEAEADYRTSFCCAPVASGHSYCPAHRRRSRRSGGC